MKRVRTFFFIIIVFVCIGAGSNTLLGTWQTGIIESEWGPCIHTVTYMGDGTIVGNIRLTEEPKGSDTISYKGQFTVNGNTIIRNTDGRDVIIDFEISDNLMKQTIGDEIYIFTRK